MPVVCGGLWRPAASCGVLWRPAVFSQTERRQRIELIIQFKYLDSVHSRNPNQKSYNRISPVSAQILETTQHRVYGVCMSFVRLVFIFCTQVR